MSQSADRNLLFGILALQLNFVTRDQLIEGMNKWVLDKSRSLGEIFVDGKTMEREQHQLLEALVQKHVEKNSGDVHQSLQQLSSFDLQAKRLLQKIDDSDLLATVMQMPEDPFETAATPEKLSRSSSRFRIIRPHARGGLGEVFLAKDTELSRDVALKEIQDRYADRSDSRARFLREAEITGRLEHPGIVPVYGLGTYDDGRPFYAMKFVKGQSLQEAIERFHKDPETKVTKSFMTGNVGIKFRELLGRFIDVCNAVHYAHSRGILHRDLKPGNVMIGEYGETLVVDWGLAKVLKEKVVADSTHSVIEPSSGGDSAPTIYGSAIGTPGYMSPEQAAGQVESLGAASDVYSLGVTLYTLLTGRAPFHQDAEKNEGVGELLAKVRRGEFQNPKELRAALPKALCAICVKAMATSAVLRYPSAQNLATEVERFLADEPIDALPETIFTRSSRLARRHRSLLLASSLSLLLITAISFAAFWLVNEQRKANAILADVNGRLALEKGELAERNAELFQSERESKNAIQEAASEIGKLASTLSVDKGTDWMIKGDLDIAANWFARACDLSTDEQLPERQVARKNLNVYLDSLHKLDRVIYDAEPLLAVVHDPLSDAVITCSKHGKLRKLSLEDGTWSSRCEFKVAELSAVAISRSLELAATIDTQGSLALWNAETGEQIEDQRSDTTESATALSFSADGKLLAVAFRTGVQLWHCDSMSWDDQLIPTDFRVGAIAFDPNSTFMVIGGSNTKVWSLTDSKWLGNVDVGHACMGIAVDGLANSFLVGRWMESRLFRWQNNSVQGTTIYHHGISFVTSVSLNSSSTMFCATGTDGSATVWDIESRQRLAQPLRHALQGLQGSLFSKDGRTLITYGGLEQGRAEVRIWKISDRTLGDLVLRHDAGIVSVTYSNDGSLIAFFDAKSRVYVAERSTGRILSGPLIHNSLLYTGAEPCSALCFTPDNKLLCATSMSGGVCLWDWRNTKLSDVLVDNGQLTNAPNTNSVRDACISNNGRALVVAGGLSGIAGYVRVYDLLTGKKVNEHVEPGSRVHCVANVPGVDAILIGGDFRHTKLWQLHSNTPPINHIEHPGVVYSVAFADNGRRLVAGYFQSTVQIWDYLEKHPLGSPLTHGMHIRKLLANNKCSEFVSSDGKHLRWWDVKTQNAIGPPTPIPEYHNGIALAPDGADALAGFPDGSLRAFTSQSLRTSPGREVRGDVSVITGIQVDDAGAVRPFSPTEWEVARSKTSDHTNSLNAVQTPLALTTPGNFQRQIYFGDIDAALSIAEAWYSSSTAQPQALYRASAMFAECARLIRGTRQTSHRSTPQLLSHVQSRAVESLRTAMAAGYMVENSARFAREFEGIRHLAEFHQSFNYPMPATPIKPLGEEAAHLDLAFTRYDDKVCVANAGTGGTLLWNFDAFDMKSLDWIKDGRELVVRQGNRLLTFNPMNAPARQLLVELEPKARQTCINPTGSHTAFESTKTYEVPRIVVLDNQTKAETLVCQFGYDPAWSLDGKLLALFDVGDTSRPGVIKLFESEALFGTKPEQSQTSPITPRDTLIFPVPASGSVYPVLSADGSLVAFGMQGDDGTRQIGLATVSTLQMRQVTKNGKNNLMPSISPDGRYIAYLSNDRAPYELAVWDLKKEQETVVADEAALCRPAWRLRPKAE